MSDMQGKRIFGFILLAAISSTGAMANESPKRMICSKPDPVQQTQQRQQQPQRVRTPECRASRIIPPVIDPTPLFIL